LAGLLTGFQAVADWRSMFPEAVWLARQIDAYEQVYLNLKVHAPAYPTPDISSR